MPIYEYKCQRCGAALEKLVRNEGDIPSDCPECGASQALAKQFSTFSPASATPRSPGCGDGPCEVAASCPSGGCCAAMQG